MQKAIKMKKCCAGMAKAILFALLSLVIYSFLSLLITGCTQTVTIEKPVPYLVPQICALNLTNRPEKNGEIVTDVKNIAQYAEKAEAAAVFCGAKK
ncbi:MAG: hypothetical protein LBL65_05570 [Campylobacteraceae bacterium]|jgi:hypothetical protein|nr:hypothetical protein [Campylobacteraceae bacterium]